MARGEIDSSLVNKLATIVKKNPGQSETWYANELGVPGSQLLRILVHAEIKADPSLDFSNLTGKALAARIVKAKEQDKLRWPRVAARAGVSVGEAQRLYQESSGRDPKEAYTGRGRNFTTAPAAPRGARTERTSAQGGGARGKAAPAATSGRRGSGQGNKASGATSGRRGQAQPAASGRGTRGTRGSDPR